MTLCRRIRTKQHKTESWTGTAIECLNDFGKHGLPEITASFAMPDRKHPSGALLAEFLVAFAAGCIISYGIAALAFISLFDMDGALFLPATIVAAAPLAGLTMFRLIFGRTGYWNGPGFWLIGIPAAYATLIFTFWLITANGRLALPSVLISATGLLIFSLCAIWKTTKED
ncbi:hypothetical protein [Paracoccus xiamenensis]|uniref:hypothetical protein n=1 Tax=Paracoccus xiamenensis TaxID=2714901 RepID=UPI00140B83C5|nr:hypothetical protein [Paracoccus xiamenensis]NHF72059.1 hypothetical protein [Paracoccus xiamenensis]